MKNSLEMPKILSVCSLDMKEFENEECTTAGEMQQMPLDDDLLDLNMEVEEMVASESSTDSCEEDNFEEFGQESSAIDKCMNSLSRMVSILTGDESDGAFQFDGTKNKLSNAQSSSVPTRVDENVEYDPARKIKIEKDSYNTQAFRKSDSLFQPWDAANSLFTEPASPPFIKLEPESELPEKSDFIEDSLHLQNNLVFHSFDPLISAQNEAPRPVYMVMSANNALDEMVDMGASVDISQRKNKLPDVAERAIKSASAAKRKIKSKKVAKTIREVKALLMKMQKKSKSSKINTVDCCLVCNAPCVITQNRKIPSLPFCKKCKKAYFYQLTHRYSSGNVYRKYCPEGGYCRIDYRQSKICPKCHHIKFLAVLKAAQKVFKEPSMSKKGSAESNSACQKQKWAVVKENILMQESIFCQPLVKLKRLDKDMLSSLGLSDTMETCGFIKEEYPNEVDTDVLNSYLQPLNESIGGIGHDLLLKELPGSGHPHGQSMLPDPAAAKILPTENCASKGLITAADKMPLLGNTVVRKRGRPKKNHPTTDVLSSSMSVSRLSEDSSNIKLLGSNHPQKKKKRLHTSSGTYGGGSSSDIQVKEILPDRPYQKTSHSNTQSNCHGNSELEPNCKLPSPTTVKVIPTEKCVFRRIKSKMSLQGRKPIKEFDPPSNLLSVANLPEDSWNIELPGSDHPHGQSTSLHTSTGTYGGSSNNLQVKEELSGRPFENISHSVTELNSEFEPQRMLPDPAATKILSTENCASKGLITAANKMTLPGNTVVRKRGRPRKKYAITAVLSTSTNVSGPSDDSSNINNTIQKSLGSKNPHELNTNDSLQASDGVIDGSSRFLTVKKILQGKYLQNLPNLNSQLKCDNNLKFDQNCELPSTPTVDKLLPPISYKNNSLTSATRKELLPKKSEIHNRSQPQNQLKLNKTDVHKTDCPRNNYSATDLKGSSVDMTNLSGNMCNSAGIQNKSVNSTAQNNLSGSTVEKQEQLPNSKPQNNVSDNFSKFYCKTRTFRITHGRLRELADESRRPSVFSQRSLYSTRLREKNKPVKIATFMCGHTCSECNTAESTNWLVDHGYTMKPPLLVVGNNEQLILDADSSTHTALIMQKLFEIDRLLQGKGKFHIDLNEGILKFQTGVSKPLLVSTTTSSLSQNPSADTSHPPSLLGFSGMIDRLQSSQLPSMPTASTSHPPSRIYRLQSSQLASMPTASTSNPPSRLGYLGRIDRLQSSQLASMPTANTCHPPSRLRYSDRIDRLQSSQLASMPTANTCHPPSRLRYSDRIDRLQSSQLHSMPTASSALPLMSTASSALPSVPTASSALSLMPTASPSLSSMPTASPSLSSMPKTVKELLWALKLSSMPTASPAKTSMPTASPAQTSMPTASPSLSSIPTASPAQPSMPTASPSLSSMPTASPAKTSMPTASPAQTSMPTASPSLSSMPTASPALPSMPTASPALPSMCTASPALPSMPTAIPAEPSSHVDSPVILSLKRKLIKRTHDVQS